MIVYTSYMIILNRWEEKLLHCFAFIGMIFIVANETLYRVKYRK